MANQESNIRYVKVTDTSSPVGPQVGYHSVETADIVDANGKSKPWEFPKLMGDGQSWEFVDEAEARENHPALFGIAPKTEPMSEADIKEQIALLQKQLKTAPKE